MRLNKFISQSGYCSRRQADELIKHGKILLNNVPVKEMGVQVDPLSDVVRVKKGPLLKLSRKKQLIMLHKPKGYVCTKSDRHAKRTVYELLPPEYQSLNSIGRLDKDSEGLLLFTNDGELAERLTHPKYAKEKSYLVTIRGRLDEQDFHKLRKGIRLIGYRAQPAKVKEIQYDEKTDRSELELTIKEGKKRQIREMFLALKHPVKRLLRVSVGPYRLGRMRVGEWRVIT